MPRKPLKKILHVSLLKSGKNEDFHTGEEDESVHPSELDVQNQIYRNIYLPLAFFPAIPSYIRRLLVRRSQHRKLLTTKLHYLNS